jgi:phospholipid-binding lipoprotein MlaA
MRDLIFILALLLMIAVPAFAETPSSLQNVQLATDLQTVSPPLNYLPEMKIPEGLSGPGIMTEKKEVLLYAQELDDEEALNEEYEEDPEDLEEDEMDEKIPDPLESINRVVFKFNDRLYFWVLKPVAKGYSTIVPEELRVLVRNFFNNVATPVRLVNNLLQFKVKSASNELVRFGINSTIGMLGLYDIAKSEMGIKMQDEDFGQTLGVWGAGPVIYINWPIIGPSNLRDSFGFVGDYFLDPVNYVNPMIDRYAIKLSDTVNRTSLRIGDYEEIKKDAIDPYAAIRDIYFQYRESKIDR